MCAGWVFIQLICAHLLCKYRLNIAQKLWAITTSDACVCACVCVLSSIESYSIGPRTYAPRIDHQVKVCGFRDCIHTQSSPNLQWPSTFLSLGCMRAHASPKACFFRTFLHPVHAICTLLHSLRQSITFLTIFPTLKLKHDHPQQRIVIIKIIM